MALLFVVDDVSDKVSFSPTVTVDAPDDLCRSVLDMPPRSLLRILIPPFIKIPGFRSPAAAPRSLLFQVLRDSKPSPLGSVLTGICLDIIEEIHPMSEEDIAGSLSTLVQRFDQTRLHFALLIDKRESVQRLTEQLHTATLDEAERMNMQLPHTDTPTYTQGACQKRTAAPNPLQKQINQLKKELNLRDDEIRKLRKEKGERDRALGHLRQMVESKESELHTLHEQLSLAKALLAELEHYQEHDAALTVREAHLEKREHECELVYGKGATRLKAHALQTARRLHDLESRWTGLTLALQDQAHRRDMAMSALEQLNKVPITGCINAVKSFLEAKLKEAAQKATSCSEPAAHRLACIATMQDLLHAESVLDRLETDDAAVALGDVLGETLHDALEGLRACESSEVVFTGTVRYEGPNAWLIAGKEVIGLPCQFVEAEGLVTGDSIRLTLYHDRDSMLDIDVTDIEKVERLAINDALRQDQDGLYVLTPHGWRLSVSEMEYMRTGVEVGSPIQVLAARSVAGTPQRETTPVYGRIIKEFPGEIAECRPRTITKASRKDRVAEKHHAELQPILSGQRLLVVGGDGYEQSYRTVVENMGGSFEWQSGFDQVARVPTKVRSSDLVIVVTGCVFHTVSNRTEHEARRHCVPICFLNSLGRTSFVKFLTDIVSRLGAAPMTSAGCTETGSL